MFLSIIDLTSGFARATYLELQFFNSLINPFFFAGKIIFIFKVDII